MKRITNYTFLFLLTILSFCISHNTLSYLRQNDNIMLFLNTIKDNYYQEPILPIINKNTIIPGLNGVKINLDKSYNNIKKVGKFNELLLIYDEILNENPLSNNKDKFIIAGNAKKNMVSLFIYLDNQNISFISEYETPLNLLVNYNFYELNLSLLKELIKKGHSILIYDVNDKNIYNIKLPTKYCFNATKDLNYLNICHKANYYSIYQEPINSSYLRVIKSNLEAGSFFALKGISNNELNASINYINSKGYKIVNLSDHLKETI